MNYADDDLDPNAYKTSMDLFRQMISTPEGLAAEEARNLKQMAEMEAMGREADARSSWGPVDGWMDKYLSKFVEAIPYIYVASLTAGAAASYFGGAAGGAAGGAGGAGAGGAGAAGGIGAAEIGGTIGTTMGAGGIPQVIISGAAPGAAAGGMGGLGALGAGAAAGAGLAAISGGATPPPNATQPAQPGSSPDAPLGDMQTVTIPGTRPPAGPGLGGLLPPYVPLPFNPGIPDVQGPPTSNTPAPPGITDPQSDLPPYVPLPFNPGVPDVQGPGSNTPGTGGTTPGSGSGTGLPGLGDIIGGLGPILGGINDYQNSQQDRDWWKSQIDTLMGMYKPGTPEAELMRQKMEAKDAATGRRSQYGIREKDLAAQLAGKRSDIMTSAGYQNMANAYRNRDSQSLNGLFSAFGNQGTTNLLSSIGNLFK